MATSTSTLDDLHPDVLTAILHLLDAPTLASAACSTSHLRALAVQTRLWEDLCLSAWPSLRHPRLLQLLRSSPDFFRSFFSDAHAFPHPAATRALAGHTDPPQLLISAVDLHQKGKPIFFRIVETETQGPWFLCSPFQVDAMDGKDASQAPVISPWELTLSWVVIDPASHRAANLSSRRPVCVEKQWYTAEILVRFAVVLDGGHAAAMAVVVCDEEMMQAKEVRLSLVNMDETCLNGKESLAILQAALEGDRKGRGEEGAAEARRRYAEYFARKQERKKRSLKREVWLDTCCIIVGLTLSLGFLAIVVLR